MPLGMVSFSVFEYKEDIIILDYRLSFPDEDMLGVDFIIPDVFYLTKNKVKAIVLTHGHGEDK